MKKIIAVLTLFLALTICGCTPEAKSENELKTDFLASDFYKENYIGNYSITDFTITERRTDSKAGTDYIEVDTKIEDSEQTHYFSHQITMDYKLYDDGWKLEKIATIERKTTPISKPDYSEEAIKNMIASVVDGSPENIQIGEVEGSIEERYFSCTVTCLAQHKYANDNYELHLSWSFDENSASWKPYTVISSYNADWSKLYGLYRNETILYGIKEGITPIWFENGIGYLNHIYYSDYAGKQTKKTYEIFHIQMCSDWNFLKEYHLINGLGPKKVESGYAFRVTNSPANDYMYIIPEENLLIGKDSFAEYSFNIQIYDSSREVVWEYKISPKKLDSSYDLNNLG